MQPWHVVISSKGRRTLFPRGTLPAARATARVGGDALLLFSIVDDHAHFVVHGTRTDASHLAGALTRALAAAGAPERDRAFIQPVSGRTHLETLVRYTAIQVEKHGLRAPSATWPGSSAPDLLGLRRLPGFDPERIAASLPRFDVAETVARACNVQALATTTDPRSVPANVGYALALDAGGVSPGDRDWNAVAVRVAWASVGGRPDAIAPRTWRELKARPADPLLVDVIRRRVAFALQP